MTMPIVQKNFENPFLADLFKITDGVVSINYGFNSGGYESYIYFYTQDGGKLAINTVLNEFTKVDFNDQDDPQWFIVGYDVNYEDPEMYDDSTNELIPCAYESDEQDDPEGYDPDEWEIE